MEFEIERSPFLAALASAAAVADRKTTMPILANVLLRTDGKRLGIAATDLALTVSAELDAKVKTGGSCTTPARDLYGFVKSLSADTVKVVLKETFLSVRAGKSSCELPILPPRDFPKLPDHRELTMVEVDAAVLRDVLAKTCYAVSSDSSRPQLTGVHLVATNGTLTAEATDGHRAVKITRPLAAELPSLLLPLGAANEIQRLIADAKAARLTAKDTYLYIAVGETVIAAKLLGDNFPDLAQVLPKRKDTGSANRAVLLAAFRRMALFANAKDGTTVANGGGVKVTLSKGVFALMAVQVGGGKGEDEIASDYDGATLEFGLNGGYAVEALETLEGETVVFQVKDDGFEPIMLRGTDDAHAVAIMKMKI